MNHIKRNTNYRNGTQSTTAYKNLEFKNLRLLG